MYRLQGFALWALSIPWLSVICDHPLTAVWVCMRDTYHSNTRIVVPQVWCLGVLLPTALSGGVRKGRATVEVNTGSIRQLAQAAARAHHRHPKTQAAVTTLLGVLDEHNTALSGLRGET
jgi:hypothetical protein